MATEIASRAAGGRSSHAVLRPLPEDLAPLRALAAVESEPHTVFFESAGAPGESADWTFLAFDPAWRLEVADGRAAGVRGRDRIALPGVPLDAGGRLAAHRPKSGTRRKFRS